MIQQIRPDRSPKPANQIVKPTLIVCPQCSSVEHLKTITCKGVDKYYCQSCLYYFSPYSNDDMWFVSELGLKFPPHDRRGDSILNFSRIEQEWLKNISKKFIKYKASTGISLSLLSYNLVGHKEFSTFLRSHPEIACFEDIDRSLIIQYIQENHTKGLSSRTKNSRLFSLANLFETGTANGWFVLQPYLIRKEDYAKFAATPLPRYIYSVPADRGRKNLPQSHQ